MRTATLISSLILIGGSLAHTADEEKGKKEIPWGPERDGVRIRLIPMADSFAVGRPMPFQIEMKNVSDDVVHYDSQGVGVNDSFEVKNAAGNEVPHIGGSVQTTGGERPLEPGKAVVLSKRIDLLFDYLITEPGSYSIKLRGQGAAFGNVRFPASNVVEIEVGEGKVSLARSVSANVIKSLPDARWEATVRDDGITLYCNQTGLKVDVLVLSIELADKGEKKEGVMLGSKGGKRVYLNNQSGGEDVNKVWEGYREKIRAALDLDPT